MYIIPNSEPPSSIKFMLNTVNAYFCFQIDEFRIAKQTRVYDSNVLCKVLIIHLLFVGAL